MEPTLIQSQRFPYFRMDIEETHGGDPTPNKSNQPAEANKEVPRDAAHVHVGTQHYLKQFPSDETTSTPELMPLYLPSFFPAAQQHLICQPNLNELEDRLRFAQTTEALSNLRRQLRTRSFANSYKTRNAHSQGAYTRSQLLQNQIEVALLSLRGPGDWETSLRPLHAEDIRGINERALTAEEQEEYRHARLLAGVSPESVQNELDGRGVTSGQENAPTVAFNRSLALGKDDEHYRGFGTPSRMRKSWGRRSASLSVVNKIPPRTFTNVCPGLRVEWVKARARADRWQEEVLLLEEEMRRAIAFCKWKAEYWDNAATTRCPDDIDLREGIRAYAYRQAANERRRASQWKDKWQAIREHARLVMNEQHGQIDDGLTVPPH
ncbi:CxC2 domain-containing protein [Salix suchowensis]|nr:CxC2 domain-containing protein [Salix suchowensis]